MEVGLLPDYAVERFRISDRTQFSVNLASGNLMIDHRDLTVRGTGTNLDLHHIYNSRSYYEDWAVNVGQYMFLQVFSNTVLMRTDSQACAAFSVKQGGGYDPASHGLRATLTKNAGGSYTVRFIDSGQTWNYNPDGYLLNRMDRNGNSITYYYNSDGTVASVSDSQGRVTTLTYTAGELTRITDPSGTVVNDYNRTTVNGNDRVTMTDRDGKHLTFDYTTDTDGSTHVTSVTDELGRTWVVGYTGNKVTSVRTPRQAGAVTTAFSYDSSSQTTETDPNNHKSVYTLDTGQRVLSVKDALGHNRSQTWTSNSNVQTTSDGLNNSTTAGYDALQNLTSVKLPSGATSVVGYTSAAQPNSPTSIKDPAGHELTNSYDNAGNLTKVRSTQLAADVETRSYTGPRKLLADITDGNGNTTTFGYDAAGNLTSTTPPAPRGAITYGYDSLSRLTSVAYPTGKRIDYSYDKLDRVVAVSFNGSVLQSMNYDALGNLASRSTPAETTSFSYDGYPTGSLITSASRVQNAVTETVTYGYDPAGNLATLTDPTGTATYTYDAANRLTALADPASQSTSFGYDNANRRTTTTFPGAGSQTNAYDVAGRLTSLSVKNTGGTEVFKATYSHTTSGGADSDQLQSKTVAGTTSNFSYDSLKHLSAAGSTTFTVDKADNITAVSGAAHTVNPANQLVAISGTTLAYDATGNLATTSGSAGNSTYQYSPTNQLTQISTGSTPTFTASFDTVDQTQPRTITETQGSTTTTRVFTQSALGVSSLLSNGISTTVARDVTGLPVTLRNGSARYNMIVDDQGSVLAMLSTTGTVAATYTYTPYGAVTASGTSAGANPFRYLGAFTLDNGLTWLGKRYYNSAWGRFTAPDPSGQEANAYAYGRSDPINRTDPTGEFSFAGLGSSLLKGAGKLLGDVVTPIAVGCYISRAASDNDSRWADEFHDLGKCFGSPFSNYFKND